ncbi:DoxX family protein [Hymenobacter volaticus]|uniref:DoxX family protein n=1 Tax=Hymenobacter volaticus TaxID=2932254 RepID=A0ABY4G8D9_9BACT|nr:DoxX family protein [Hymenobacter volaticus]UOQ67021.1 DoxX family protein [Hymenobacter volaticus]
MALSTPTHPAGHRTKNSASNPVWMDALRILLGLFLFIKGVSFLSKSSDVYYLLSQQQSLGELSKAPLFFSIVHMLGGLMIAFGALTRLALLCQMPIVFGAALVVNPQRGVNTGNTELWLSLLVLGLLLFFMIKGPGRHSIDNKVFRPQPDLS